VAWGAAAESAEQDPREYQNTQCLPEGDPMPAEKRRRQPIPEIQDNQTKQSDEQYSKQRKFQYSQEPVPSHD
jgi:hypothetical protein